MNSKVVLYPKGTLREEIDLNAWDFPNLRLLALMTNHNGVRQSLQTLNDSMDDVIQSVRENLPFPEQVHLPDLWHYRNQFTREDAEEMWSAVGAAKFILEQYYPLSERHSPPHPGLPGTLFKME
jgi:hypothetical protein